MSTAQRPFRVGFRNMDMESALVAPPCLYQVEQMLRTVADILDTGSAWYHDGSFHFRLDRPGWSLAITPESARRFRVEACLGLRPVDTHWSLASNLNRIAMLAAEATAMVAV